MPAKSKSQQRFFGMVVAYLNGKLKNAPESVVRAANSISKEDARHFAATKHDGLEEKKAQVIPMIILASYLAGRNKGKKIDEKKKKSDCERDEPVISGINKAAWSSTAVHVQNKQVAYDFDSIEEASAFLASIGVLSEDEISEMLYNREGLINGFAVTYPDEKLAQVMYVDPYRRHNRYIRAQKVVDAAMEDSTDDDTKEAKKRHRKDLENRLKALSTDADIAEKTVGVIADLLNMKGK